MLCDGLRMLSPDAVDHPDEIVGLATTSSFRTARFGVRVDFGQSGHEICEEVIFRGQV